MDFLATVSGTSAKTYGRISFFRLQCLDGYFFLRLEWLALSITYLYQYDDQSNRPERVLLNSATSNFLYALLIFFCLINVVFVYSNKKILKWMDMSAHNYECTYEDNEAYQHGCIIKQNICRFQEPKQHNHVPQVCCKDREQRTKFIWWNRYHINIK